MKINLSKVEVRPSLGAELIQQDFAKPVAEVIYSGCRTLEEKLFAEKLYLANGDIEITETERQMLLKASEQFLYWAQEPLKAILENVSK